MPHLRSSLSNLFICEAFVRRRVRYVTHPWKTGVCVFSLFSFRRINHSIWKQEMEKELKSDINVPGWNDGFAHFFRPNYSFCVFFLVRESFWVLFLFSEVEMRDWNKLFEFNKGADYVFFVLLGSISRCENIIWFVFIVNMGFFVLKRNWKSLRITLLSSWTEK